MVKMRIRESSRKRFIGILAVAAVLLFSLIPTLPVKGQPPTDVSGLVIPTESVETWYASESPYIAVTGSVTVQGELIIEPGVVVKFGSDCRIRVSGSLSAEGDSENPVVFTSYSDDEYGGDTNGDGPSTGIPGDWVAVDFSSGGTGTLQHTIVRWGGAYSGYSYRANVIAKNPTTSVTLQDCVVEGSSHDGICFYDRAPAEIIGTIAQDNGGNGISLRSSQGQTITGTIAQCTIQNNGYDGIYAQHASIDLQSDNISGNRFPISIGGEVTLSHDGDNTISGNTFDRAIGIAQGITGRDNSISGTLLAADALPQPIRSYLFMAYTTVASGTELVPQPGAVLKFAEGCQLRVAGTMTALGTADDPIVFTSYRDDEYGGDTNDDGPSEGAPGDWITLIFSDGGVGTLQHAIVRWGGAYTGYDYRANVIAAHTATSVTLQDCVVEGSSQDGICIYARASAEIRGTITQNNGGNGISIRSSIGTTSIATIAQCTILNNGYDGVYAQHASIDLQGDNITGNRFPISVGGEVNFSHDGNNSISENTYDRAIGIAYGIQNRSFWMAGTLLGADSLPQPIRSYLFMVSPSVLSDRELVPQPGAILKFAQGCQLRVAGTLTAIGTVDDPIVFTSYRDDEYGGDTNADGYSEGVPGDWDRLEMGDGMGVVCQLEHMLIRFGGSGNYGSFRTYYHSTLPDETLTSIADSRVEQSSSAGINSNNSLLSLGSVEVVGCEGDAVEVLNHSQVTLEDCSLLDNSESGVYINDSEITLNGNTISGNAYPLSVGSEVVLHQNGSNTIIGNTFNRAVELRGNYMRGTYYGPDNLPQPLDTYVLKDEWSTIQTPSGNSLNIEPGAIVKFKQGNAGLVVYGSIMVVGTADKPIVFTSYKDDEYGGDTNGDGYSTGEPSDWNGINIISDIPAVLDNVKIRYGWYGIHASGSHPRVINSTIQFSQREGLYCESGTELIVMNSNIMDNGRSGIYVEQSSANITQSSLSNNTNAGIHAKDSRFHIARCTIFGNDYPIWLQGSMEFSHEFNIILHNTYNRAILVTAGTINGTLYSTQHLPPPITSYTMDIWPGVTVSAGEVLEIEPGAILKFDAGYLQVYGTLHAEASQGNEIIFTSYRDDEYGGDTNADGLSSGELGDWGGIIWFASSTDSVLRHAVVRYGGLDGSLHFSGANPLVENCMISQSNRGVYCRDAATPLLYGNLITENGVGIYCRDGASPIIGGAAEFQNDIFGNTEYAVQNLDSSVTVDARFNYWGDPTGPYDPSEGPPLNNPDGLGDMVTDYVDYGSWTSAPSETGRPQRGPDVWVELIGDLIVPPEPTAYQVWYGNDGDISAGNATLQLNLPEGLTYNTDSSGLTANVSVDLRTITWQLGSLAPWENNSFYISANTTEGVAGELTTQVQISTLAEDQNLTNNTSSLESSVEEPEPRIDLYIYSERLRPGFTSECTVFYVNTGTSPAYDARAVVQLDTSTFEDGTRRMHFVDADASDPEVTYEYDAETHTVTFYLGDVYPTYSYRPFGLIPRTYRFWRNVDRLNTPCTPMGCVISVYQRSEGAEAALSMSGVPWDVPGHVVGSADPNDKQVSPGGYDWSAGYVRGDKPFTYTVRFENKPEATAEATYITIEDYFDVNLDWSTLEVTGIKVGDTLYSPLSYDRGTLEISFDPTAGFLQFFFDGIDLYPNVNPPEGEGMVAFTIAPKLDLPDGTQIRNEASIVFDYNAPIITPETVNTIDKTPPQSHVLPLPETSDNTTFEVRWEGTDAISGVRHYTIFVSVGGGDFTPWTTNTTDTSANFTGEIGYTYAFYSTAFDNAWNLESPPTMPDTQVSISVQPGDANGDNITNIFDMTKVARIILEMDNPTPGADANQDGSINVFDMTKIARIILELD